MCGKGLLKSVLTSCLLIGYCLQYSQTVKADFMIGEPSKVANVNSNGSDGSPQISRDGLALYYNYNAGSGCSYDVWVAKRPTTNDAWSAPVKLDFLEGYIGPQRTPSLSGDGLELYFSDGHETVTGCPPNASGFGGSDLWVAKRSSKEDPWGVPENLGSIVNTAHHEDTPCISADGLSLYYMSNIISDPQNSEILMATRQSKDAPWEKPVNVGPNVNSNWYEYTPYVSTDGLTLFFSRGFSKPHTYVSRRRSISEPWGRAELFMPINSLNSAWGIPDGTEVCLSYSEMDSALYFTHATSLFTFDADIWQVKVTPILDLNSDGNVDKLDQNILINNWGATDSSLYDIAPIPFGDGVVDDKDLLVMQKELGFENATNPYPAFREKNVAYDVTLTWEPGEFAQSHDIYFGTDSFAVNDANSTDASYMGQQDTTRFYPGKLDFDTTYFWRVDEVNGAPDFDIFKGTIWRFTTESYSNIVLPRVATASSSFMPTMGPEKTIDGSGLDELDQHSTNGADMWLTSATDSERSIQYEFSRPEKLDKMLVWNSNQTIESFVGFGVRDVTIEISIDGTAWAILDGVPELAQATGSLDYTYNTVIDFGGATAKYVKLKINDGWGSVPQFGLSEVRFYAIPVYAKNPQPASGSTTDSSIVDLQWRAGREASIHEVVLSHDRSAVEDNSAAVGATQSTSFRSEMLNFGTEYFWRIIEVNEAATPPRYESEIWSFTTPGINSLWK